MPLKRMKPAMVPTEYDACIRSAAMNGAFGHKEIKQKSLEENIFSSRDSCYDFPDALHPAGVQRTPGLAAEKPCQSLTGSRSRNMREMHHRPAAPTKV